MVHNTISYCYWVHSLNVFKRTCCKTVFTTWTQTDVITNNIELYEYDILCVCARVRFRNAFSFRSRTSQEILHICIRKVFFFSESLYEESTENYWLCPFVVRFLGIERSCGTKKFDIRRYVCVFNHSRNCANKIFCFYTKKKKKTLKLIK